MNQTTVLIADDNAGVRKVLTRYLRAGGRSLLMAEDGDAALEMARLHLPDLIILDVRMPGRDGFQVCSELREAESTRHIPVLMITGLGEADTELDRIDGADDCLSKPFDFNELEARVSALLGRKSQ